MAPLVVVGDTLYGTTSAGGFIHAPVCRTGCGTVFSLTPEGTKTTLVAFTGGADGSYPQDGLYADNGLLFGTTRFGGFGSEGGYGTAYKLTPAGAEDQVFKFSKPIGTIPNGPLTQAGAHLFGITAGQSLAGTSGSVYLVTPSGKPRLVHAFGGAGDGYSPSGALLNVGGTLYGTTRSGGTDEVGTVFAATPDGVETVLYSFKARHDGRLPNGGLVNIGGTLYGTTQGGGALGSDCGVVFKLAPDGTETVLHSFNHGRDGCGPTSGLTRVGNLLYGTTPFGSAANQGSIFLATQTGGLRVLHAFQGGADGATPFASLLSVGGALYGTTAGGGTSNSGTVFKVVP